MSDLKRYIETRKAKDPAFADGFDAGYTDFKIGALLQQARETAGLTQEQVALRLGTKKSAISRIENHAENATLLTLKAYAQAVGGTLQVQLLLGSLTR
ncbi:MAG: transcriptional regulator [Chloroflexi bacterium HGW-Chloroflexi-1]|nr:MAG: transcriptional regulator [Chloroflexi bacterium HGW-Chloroflexi-1]